MILCLANNNCVDRSHGRTTIFPTLNFFFAVCDVGEFLSSLVKKAPVPPPQWSVAALCESRTQTCEIPHDLSQQQQALCILMMFLQYYLSHPITIRMQSTTSPIYIIGIVYCYRRFYSPMHLHFLPTCYLGIQVKSYACSTFEWRLKLFSK